MKRVVVRYKVRPELAEENEALVRDVYAELETSRPEGLRYATFKLEDGVSFVHIAEHGEKENPLPEMKAFQQFQKDIRDRCEEPPVATEAEVVGSFRFFS